MSVFTRSHPLHSTPLPLSLSHPQVSTFDYLFCHLLLPGGTYIIEDVETSYWTQNGLYGYTTRYGYHHERSCVEVFKDLLDDVNGEYLR